MRSVVLVAVLISSMAMGGTDVPAAQKKQQLAAMARDAAQKPGAYGDYLVRFFQPMPRSMLWARDMEPFVLPSEGWSTITDYGIWSLGELSSLYLLLEEGEHPRRLFIQGSYFNGQEATLLFVNGMLLSEAALEERTIDLPPSLNDATYLHIELHHLNPVAPHDIKPESADRRRIKFKLEKIRVW